MKANKVRGRVIPPLVAAFLGLAAAVTAQETRGRITGQVVDTTKAALPGASVTVTDQARGTAAFSTTNAEGLFQANYLLSGTYQVTVELAGFKKYVQKDVAVTISETRDLRITLDVGRARGSGQRHRGGGGPQHLRRQPGPGHRRRSAWPSLPLIHGDPYKLMGLAAGVTHSGSQRLDRPFEPTHIVGYAYGRHAQQPQRPADRRVPSTATANAERGHRDLRPAVRHGAGVQGPDRDLRRPVRQHRRRRHQHGIKCGNQPLHGSAYYFAEPVEPLRQRLLRQGPRAGARRQHLEPARLHARRPVASRPLQREDKTFFMCRLRAHHGQAARASTRAGTRGCRPRRCATATSRSSRPTSRSTTR